MKLLPRRFYHKSILLLMSGLLLYGINAYSASPKQTFPDTSLVSTYLKRANSLNTDSAIYYYQKAIELTTESATLSIPKNLRNKIKRQFIQAELGIGLIYYQNLDYTKAMTDYEQAYKSAKELDDHFFMAECLFNFAEVHLEKSEYALAMNRYSEALQEYTFLKNKSAVYWCYNGMGITQKQCGNFNDAIICYENALAIANEASMKPEVAYCYNNLGNVYRKQGNFLKSMDAYEKALTCFNEVKDELAVSDCLNNIGNLYLDKGDPFRALDYYNRSLNFEQVKSDNYRMVIRYKNLADAYSNLKDYSNATMFLDKAVKLAEKSGDKTQLASCYSLIGDLHFVNGNREIGISYLKKSAEMFHEVEAKAEEAEVLIALATAELTDNRVQEALLHAQLGEKQAQDVGAIKIFSNASDCLSKIWEKKGDLPKSLSYLKKVLHFQDSILTVQKNRAIEEIEAGFMRTSLINENQILAQNSKLQQQSLKNRSIATYSLAICLLLSLTVIWLIFKLHQDSNVLALREKAVKQKEIEKLSGNLSVKERELTTKILFINQKNTILQNLIQELELLKTDQGNPKNKIERLQHDLKMELSPDAWKEFEVQFNDVHPEFQSRLLEKFPELTPNERRLCAFIRLDMNTREIVSLTGQSYKSIEVARTRIRKKLGLSHEENLTNSIALI
jgi:tetratricopeptide (TPR) repeat protein